MFNFLKKIVSPFTRLKLALGQKIQALFSNGVNEEAYENLERVLYEADLGAELSASIVQEARRVPEEQIIPFVKEKIFGLFSNSPELKPSNSPHVILIVGVNGSGKTTSLAKLAQMHKSENRNVLIAAGDTFRAAAVEQLDLWATKVGVDIIKAKSGGDPSAVAFDAIQAAIARKSDVILIDTAGRLQNKTDLMHELAKMRRVIQKLLPDAPHETLLVLDATLGQNALDQAKTFHQFTPITGIILTKLDGSAKGGIAAAVQKQTGIPILWAGLGEGAKDLVPFDAKEYVEALFRN